MRAAEETKIVKMVVMGDMLEWIGRLDGTDVVRRCIDCVMVRSFLRWGKGYLYIWF
jgi:hypothetical protein